MTPHGAGQALEYTKSTNACPELFATLSAGSAKDAAAEIVSDDTKWAVIPKSVDGASLRLNRQLAD